MMPLFGKKAPDQTTANRDEPPTQASRCLASAIAKGDGYTWLYLALEQRLALQIIVKKEGIELYGT